MDKYLGVLLAVFAVGGVVAAAWAGLSRGDRQNLRENNDDLRKQLADQKTAREEAERQRDLQTARADHAESDLAALGRVVTGEAHLTALGDRLDEHHAEAKDYWRTSADYQRISTEQGQQILEALRSLSGGSG